MTGTTSTSDRLERLADARILVTGSSGYVGTDLAGLLERHGIGVLGIDREAEHRIPGELLQDLCEREPTQRAIQAFSPTHIVHAGTNSAMAYRDDFLTAYREDSSALVNILELLVGKPEIRLVFFSSTYSLSGLRADGPVPETTPLHPTHNFGIGKAFFEQFILRVHPNSVVFRLSSAYGHGNAKHPNAVHGMVADCARDKKIEVWGSGSRRMQYIELPDVVARTVAALQIPPGSYNLGGDEYETVADTAAAIAGHFGAEVVFLRDKPEGMTLPMMDNRKLEQACGAPGYAPFAEGLRRYVEEFVAKAAASTRETP